MKKNDDKTLSSPVLYGKERQKILETALKMMVMIDGKVYGIEDEMEPDANIDCELNIETCRAVCCTYVFALSREEIRKGFFKHNPERPFYMALDADGYCQYLDRGNFKCTIHEKRPLRCRKYVCKEGRRLP